MGTHFTRSALAAGLIATSLAAAAPAGAMVADKYSAAIDSYAQAVSKPTQTATPRMTPPNVQRALRDDTESTRYSAPITDSLGSGSGFSWGDAALGAGGTLVVLSAAGGFALVALRRRQRSLSIAG